tara:strand:+ start:2210 stop:2536 length:327 start_codon:yes stop_codon:yes gene_type:complete
MKKPALRILRYEKRYFKETNWTKSSKSLGEYIFRRLSLDQSDKQLQKIRPRHMLSKLIVSSNEVNSYVNDYLAMLENERSNGLIVKSKNTSKPNSPHYNYEIDGISFK